MKKRTMVR